MNLAEGERSCAVIRLDMSPPQSLTLDDAGWGVRTFVVAAKGSFPFAPMILSGKMMRVSTLFSRSR